MCHMQLYMRLVLELHQIEWTKLRLKMFALQVDKLQQITKLQWTRLQKILFLLMV